jgi:hypothetical protein
MIFGGVSHERIQLNEDSVWSGGFRDRNNADAKKNLQKIRALLKEGKISEAEELARYALTGTPEARAFPPTNALRVLSKGIPTRGCSRFIFVTGGICLFRAVARGLCPQIYRAFGARIFFRRGTANLQ